MTEKKNLYQTLKEKGLIGFLTNECDEKGCRNLETRCLDCDRVVNTAKMEYGWVSVKDRYPTDEEKTLPNRILVYFPEMDFIGMHGNHISYSYWMPLPPPPKEKDGMD